MSETQIERIRKALASGTLQIVDTPLLTVIERGELPRNIWRLFAEQRYLASRNFELLLEAGVKKSRTEGYEQLAEALEGNLADERGVDEQGNKHPFGSHEQWRRDYYNALGITNDMLSRAQLRDGTKHYDDTLQQLIEEDAFAISGGLLLLELSIPKEFERIRKGRDTTFRDEFVILSSDDQEQRARKKKASRYINDHIAHDAASHYPDLENAVITYAREPLQVAHVIQGIQRIADAKEVFYRKLGEFLMK